MESDIKRLYIEEGKLNIRGLEKAITKGWLTEEEKESLIESKGEAICTTLNQ